MRAESDAGLARLLRPALAVLDSRRRMIRALRFVSLSAMTLGVGACLVSFDSPEKVADLSRRRFPPRDAGFAGVVLIGVAVAIGRAYLIRRKALLGEFKSGVVTTLVEATVDGARYVPHGHVARAVFTASRLYEGDLPGVRFEDVKGDVFSGDDLIQGTVGETPFECSELHARKEIDRYAQERSWTESVDVFLGLFVRVDLDRDLSGRTIVESRTAKRFDRSGYAAAETGGAFGARFDVYSTAPEETLDLLAPAVREKLVAFADRAAVPIRVACWGRDVVVAIEFGTHLFDLDAIAAGRHEDPVSLARPVELAADCVRVFGLDASRRRPPDPDFHARLG